MIRLDTILDTAPNIRDLDTISLSRIEMQKRRIRRQSQRGHDMGIDLPAGTILHDGAILQGEGHIVTIQQTPELVVAIRLPPDVPSSMLVLIGHTLGNMHRPINIQNGTISLPIQDSSEEDTFRRILGVLGIGDISVEKQVFVPHNRANVSGHE